MPSATGLLVVVTAKTFHTASVGGNRTFALRAPGNPPQGTEFEAHCSSAESATNHAVGRGVSAAKEAEAAACRSLFYTPLNKFNLAETTSSIASPAFRKS